MPSNVTKARKDITQAFGTELIYSDPMEGSDGAIRLVRKIVAENPDKYFYPDQYSNPSNSNAHYDGTGVEILDALGDRITHFVRRPRHDRDDHGHDAASARSLAPHSLRRGRAGPSRCTGSRG